MSLDWPRSGQTSRGSVMGPVGGLEAEASAPGGAALGVAVICHPHPQYGGTKDNKVVYTLARACRAAGLVTVRFNFRGVGKSAGKYDNGEGETEDALAVAEWALANANDKHLVWAGFSFGAAAALRAAAQCKPMGLVTVGLPTDYFKQSLPRPECPWLAVYGDADEVVDPQAAMVSLQSLDRPPDMETLAGAGHFLHGRLTELGDIVGRYLPQWLDASNRSYPA